MYTFQVTASAGVTQEVHLYFLSDSVYCVYCIYCTYFKKIIHRYLIMIGGMLLFSLRITLFVNFNNSHKTVQISFIVLLINFNNNQNNVHISLILTFCNFTYSKKSIKIIYCNILISCLFQVYLNFFIR